MENAAASVDARLKCGMADVSVRAKLEEPVMVLLHQFPRIWGLPNASPFCLKLETWLRMAGIEYQIVEVTDLRKGPERQIAVH